MKHKKIMGISLISGILLFGAVGCGQKQATAPVAQDDTVVVSAAQVKSGDINAIATITGKIAARQQVNIQPKMAGKVAEVPVDVGSIVKKGQVVLVLDAKDLAAGVKQAEAGYATARANYLKTKVGARPEQRDQSQANLAQAEANYKKNVSDLARMKELYNEGAISEQALEGQKVAFASAEAGYNSAKDALTMLQKGETSETYKVLEAQMQQAQAALDLQKVNYANAVITSPIDGIVGIRNVNPGEITSNSAPPLTIIDIDTVQVETNVTETQVNKLLVGEEVNVNVNATSGKPFTGKIKSISPMANPQNKLYLIKIVIANKNHALKPGMFAEIALPVEKKQGVLLLPREAVTELNGDKVVYIVNSEGKTEIKKVDVGVSDGNSIEILGGLDKGMTVITSGQQNLQSGTKVKVETKM